MSWFVILSAVIGSWAFLRVLGGERQRQMQDLEVSILDAAIKNQSPPQSMQTPNPQ
jgi:hypothetical protein